MDTGANPRRKKLLTRDQIGKRQAQAVRFAREIVGDPDLADEIEALTADEYAERRDFRISNQFGEEVVKMPQREKLVDVLSDRDALLDKLEEVRDELDDLLGEYDGEDEDSEDDGGDEG